MSNQLNRRHFISASALVVAGAASTTPGTAANQSPGPNPMTYEPKPLPFDAAKVSGLSEELLAGHHDNNYVGAVRRLNSIGAQLSALDWSMALAGTR